MSLWRACQSHVASVTIPAAAACFCAMRVNVLYRGAVNDLLGKHQEEIILADGATTKDLLQELEFAYPHEEQFIRSCIFEVDQKTVNPADGLKLSSEEFIEVLPPENVPDA
eukprot:GHRR01003243.1.p1 GENE.GHRR01003243.1~~GHRR01003243.1.p1  ORF type:complete len:111 (+),score=19.40 GHRR01003243.1:74-406(+)